jgi:Cft2 family RNA processing exonuclease
LKVIYDRGIYLPEIDLWMDAKRPKARSVISHAHADHIQSHNEIIATPATARIFEHRVRPTDSVLLDFNETRDFGDFKLTFYPAGHCLGSAQTLIEHKGERLLYTGDFKLRCGLSCEPPEIVPCDTLLTECTFGQPHFIFPSDDEVRRVLCEEVDRAFLDGLQPVVFGYSLGKSQEALQILLAGGYSVAVHDSVMAIVEIYRDMGVKFEGDYRPLDYADTDGLVILAPPGSRRGYQMQSLGSLYTIYLSGWGMDARARYRYGCDLVLPLSDHAGFDDLNRYVVESGAKKVYTLYGDHYFASHLRRMGVDAEHLHEYDESAAAAARRQRAKKKPASGQASLFDLIEGSAPLTK